MEIESAAHKAATTSPAGGARTVVRRAVQIGCTVRSELWDGPAPFLATDLSPDGLRLCSPLALPEGQDVVVTFTPPCWPDENGPLNVVARVQHVALPRRKSDPMVAGLPGEAGMGLSFLHIDPTHRALLHLVLRGLPPPLPARSNQEAQLALDELETVLSFDGLAIQLAAEAPLLTASRPSAKSEPLSHAGGFTTASVLRRKFRSFRYRPRTGEPEASAPTATEQSRVELSALH